MQRMLTKIAALAATWSLPALAFAAAPNFIELNTYGYGIIDFINRTLVPLIFAIAFLIFIWGAFQYFILAKGSEEGQEKGKQLMLWGFIGFFVMVAVWGIVNLLVGASGLGGQNLNNLPNAPGSGGGSTFDPAGSFFDF